jgi:hypothetical protein
MALKYPNKLVRVSTVLITSPLFEGKKKFRPSFRPGFGDPRKILVTGAAWPVSTPGTTEILKCTFFISAFSTKREPFLRSRGTTSLGPRMVHGDEIFDELVNRMKFDRMNGKTCLTPRRVPVQHLVKSSGEQRDRELAAGRLQSLSRSPVRSLSQNFENWHLHQVENVKLWTEENHRPQFPLQEIHSDSSRQVLPRSCSKEAEQLAGGVSMLEETEVAMRVKAATKIQAIARVRARKQEKEKALKASHARVQSCDNSKEARIKSEQTIIMSDTLITDSEFELWTEENHPQCPLQEIHSDSSKQVLSRSFSKEAGHFETLAAGVSMLEETEVAMRVKAMRVKAATKIQAIARVRARKQEKEKALKASHARVQSCDNSKEARIKSEQSMILSDTLITDSEFSKMLSAGPSVCDSTFHDSHAEDNRRNRDASCVQNLIYV